MTSIITNQLIQEIDNNQEWQEKLDRQVELEEKMRGMGVDRHWSGVAKARERGQETSVRSVRRLMNSSVAKIAEGIRQFIESCESGKAGRKHSAYPLLKQIEPEAAALITARVVLDGVAKGDLLVPLARRVASLIEDELAFREFAKADKKTYDWLVKREKRVNGSSYRRQRLTMLHNMEARNIAWQEWTARESLLVGSKLIEIMTETTGLIQKITRTVDVKRQEVAIEATPETIAWINEENNRCEALSPVYLPTIIPPRPWTSPFEGGYWTPRVRRLALVKTHSKGYLEELAEHDMPEVYDAINAMQHTAWAINGRVLEVVRNLWNNGATLGGIPAADDLPLPPKPLFLEQELPREEWSEDQVRQFKEWKREATDTYAANAKLKSLRLQFAKVLMIAEMFEHEDELYFPHQFDFRGRAYAVPMFLNPQGSDIAKGLLEFANAVAINDEEGANWLAIHGANSYGYDKVSLAERVRWVQENEGEILACAADPYSHSMWAKADKPFQFLAFCIEWAEFKREGYGYLSTLPIAMDGSCNGLQNFSAKVYAKVAGAWVTAKELWGYMSGGWRSAWKNEIHYINTSARTGASIFALMGSPTQAGNYIFENRAVISAGTGSYALRTGVFPAGSTLHIINKSTIQGRGGAGGAYTSAGSAGGNAIYIDFPCTLDNGAGYIYGGGGGGGGVSGTAYGGYMRAGGGGGSGNTGGGAGSGTAKSFSGGSLTQPTAGTSSAGGSGGYSYGQFSHRANVSTP